MNEIIVTENLKNMTAYHLESIKNRSWSRIETLIKTGGNTEELKAHCKLYKAVRKELRNRK